MHPMNPFCVKLGEQSCSKNIQTLFKPFFLIKNNQAVELQKKILLPNLTLR